MIILTQLQMEDFDRENYNYIRCPRKHILGLKHRSAIVRVIPLQRDKEPRKDGLLIYCKYCDRYYMLTMEENIDQYLENL